MRIRHGFPVFGQSAGNPRPERVDCLMRREIQDDFFFQDDEMQPTRSHINNVIAVRNDGGRWSAEVLTRENLSAVVVHVKIVKNRRRRNYPTV